MHDKFDGGGDSEEKYKQTRVQTHSTTYSRTVGWCDIFTAAVLYLKTNVGSSCQAFAADIQESEKVKTDACVTV